MIKLYNISHFHLAPHAPTLPFESIKYFMCEKYGNEWKNSRILQLNFYFMPCYSEFEGALEKKCGGLGKMFVSGFASRPSSCTYATGDGTM
jgi:hypothetical protein